MPSMKRIERMNDHALLVELVKQQKRSAYRQCLAVVFLAALCVIFGVSCWILVPRAKNTLQKADETLSVVRVAVVDLQERLPEVDRTIEQADALMTSAQEAIDETKGTLVHVDELVSEAKETVSGAGELIGLTAETVGDAGAVVSEVGDLVVSNRVYVEESVRDGYRVLEILAGIFGKGE